jgi:Tol biopolymer transport system component
MMTIMHPQTSRVWATSAVFLIALPCFLAAQEYRIAFLSNRKNATGIHVMHADGSGVKQLTDDKLALLSDGAWSPDGQQLIFNALRQHGLRLGVQGPEWNDDGDEKLISKYPLPFHFPLYVMNADGSGQKRLLDVPVVPGARWSPDGKRILFTSSYEDPHRNDPGVRKGTQSVPSALYVLDLATGRYKRITSVGRTDLNVFASWSPDGARVLFTCGRRPREVCVVDADGAHEEQLTARGGTAVSTTFSPDGHRIAFVAAPQVLSDIGSGAYVMDANGAHARRISKLLVTSVSWSPDGGNVLIRAASGGTYVVNVEANTGVKLPLGSGRVLDEVFSPDGRVILYRSNEEGVDKIYAIDVDGTHRRKLSDDAGVDSLFSVSPLLR